MIYRFIVLAAVGLAGCGGSGTGEGSDIPTTSAFRATDAEGFIILDEPTGSNFSQRSIRQNFGDGVSYGVTSSEEGVAAYSDLGAPIKDVILSNPAPRGGTATFSGNYNLLGVPDVRDSLEIIEERGAIDLAVNFNDRSLTGSAGNIDFDMTIRNTQDLGGTVTWNGIEGEVSGFVGEFTALGAFHGNDEHGAYAGGINAGR